MEFCFSLLKSTPKLHLRSCCFVAIARLLSWVGSSHNLKNSEYKTSSKDTFRQNCLDPVPKANRVSFPCLFCTGRFPGFDEVSGEGLGRGFLESWGFSCDQLEPSMATSPRDPPNTNLNYGAPNSGYFCVVGGLMLKILGWCFLRGLDGIPCTDRAVLTKTARSVVSSQ